MLYGKTGVTIVYNIALSKFDFRDQWSATPQNRGRSKKNQGRTVLKHWAGSLAVGSYIQRGSAPPPPLSVLSSEFKGKIFYLDVSYGRGFPVKNKHRFKGQCPSNITYEK